MRSSLPGTHSFGVVCRSAVEAPAWWSGARGAVRCRERLALHLGRPATLAIPARGLLQRRLIGDPGRLALQNQVDTFQPAGDGAGRVARQVARLASRWPAGDIQIAVEPERPDPGGVRATIRSYRPQEAGDVGLGRAGCKQVVWPAPRDLSRSIAVEIGDLNGHAVGHRIPPVHVLIWL